MKSGLYYPDRYVRLTLDALEEVIGASGMKTIYSRSRLESLVENPLPDSLQRAFDFSDFSALFATLREIMGERGAHMLAARAGKLTFSQGLSFFNKSTEMDIDTSVETSQPVGIQLNRLANFFNSISDQVCAVEPGPGNDTFLFSIQVCPICLGQESPQPICAFFEGLLNEASRVFSGGAEVSVKELECKAAGAERCKFEIKFVSLRAD
jgi:predicted hydrocarbon binding protein